jgi:hypothetical protein
MKQGDHWKTNPDPDTASEAELLASRSLAALASNR